MASVWLGRSTDRIDHVVALKVIKPEHARNKEFIAMFKDEARIASRLSHPNIVTIHGLGHDGKRHFLAMEALRGRTLLEVWTAAHEGGRRLPYPVIAWIGARIADALHAAHELRDENDVPQNVVHRDVNPSNVFLTNAGVPKLIDFGLAKARDRLASTAVGVVKGKLAYLAPEQSHGHAADRRADVFALGVTLWEVTVDRRLFKDDSDVETVRRVQAADIPDPATLVDGYPRALADVLVRALARDPAKRWSTAAELRDALDAYVRSTGETVGEPSVRALVVEHGGGRQVAPWERLYEETVTGGSDRVRVWDDERQKMTWMQAAIETIAPNTEGQAPAQGRAPAAPPATLAEALDRALVERLAAIDPSDATAKARLHLERALVDELFGDGSRAAAHADASLGAVQTAAAHGVLRRLRHARGAPGLLVQHLDAEIAGCAGAGGRSDLLSERARILEASGAEPELVRAAWEQSLAVSPAHPAALRGLEGALAVAPEGAAAHAAHLARMADAYTSDARLSAWLHVERARVLDRALGQTDAARAALARALELDPGMGPVRRACVEHAAVHRDAQWLVQLLADEAPLESDPARAARLEVDAACVARHRLGEADRAVELLERAIARPSIPPAVRRRALDELVTLHGAADRVVDALRARRLRLTLVEDPRARAHELRVVAAMEQSRADGEAAIASLRLAFELAPQDESLFAELDARLGEAVRDDERVDLWSRRAASSAGPKRAECLVRAAHFAETIGDARRAVESLRAALVADPGNLEAVDVLLRLLTPPPSDVSRAEARNRIAVHAHAAEHAPDPLRRIAHLEAVALLQDEMLGEPALVVATYESILRVEPERRSAVVGLARAAARTGDPSMLARALIDEASATKDAGAADALRLRAAEALAAFDGDRALQLVREVVARDPGHRGARRVEQRIHEAAERWAMVDATLAVRIEHAADDGERAELWLARAELQRTRLRAPPAAIASLRAVLAIDPAHPAARDALLDELETIGDARALRDGLVELAASAPDVGERVRHLARAAEMDELVLLDDVHAAELLARACAAAPSDDGLEERRLRVLVRLERSKKQPGALQMALSSRAEASPENADRAFELALVILDGGGDTERATSLIEVVVARDPALPHGLRTLERIARVAGSVPLLANALAQQADAFRDPAARLGALWAEAALVEWKLPDGDTGPVAERILQIAPGDRAALDVTVRRAVPAARRGDREARARLVGSLRSRLQLVSDTTEALCMRLALAMALDPRADGAPDRDAALGALEQYREALRIDPHSVVAAVGAARLAAQLGDTDASVAAAIAQADLAGDPRRRAIHLTQAAGQIVSASDPRLGTRFERLARAGDLLDRALDADPEAFAAAGLLVVTRTEEGARDRLVATLRSAFERARSPEAVVQLGSELARIASTAPADRVLAIDALRRVLAASPGHPATLRALVDQYVAQGAWGEAVETLERLAEKAREPQAKLAALFELAEVYRSRLVRAADLQRVLQSALDVDPSNVRALRELVAARRGAVPPAGAEEVAMLLGRLGDLETSGEAKAAALTELAELRRASGDAAGTERALVEAVAQAPSEGRLSALLAVHPGNPAEQARVLGAAVARAQELERPDAATLASLGQLETDALGRWADAVAHLRLALALAPAMHEARAALAKALVHSGAASEAEALVMQMMARDAGPLVSVRDPASALATLERALAGVGRNEEAVVARELRAVAGGLDDGEHAALRARRLPIDPTAPVSAVLDRSVLRGSGVIPSEMPTVLLDVAAALGGVEGKLARVDIEELGLTPRDRLLPNSGHPLLPVVQRMSALLGLTRPELAIADGAMHPRVVVVQETPWLVVSQTFEAQPEPVQAALLARLLARLALSVPWLEDLPGAYAHAVLCGAARQVVAGYASEIGNDDQAELIDEYARRVGKAIGRRQKKALADLAPALASAPVVTLADVAAFERGVAQVELRVAFVMTGDLMSTLDALRIVDADLARATTQVGIPALRATLAHPLAGDLARFALAQSTSALRWRAGSLWGAR
jgi:tetratricopeptide (TPR) repeat protein/tRNA A-37 threonylcarbamoyl transferase component Bud32